MPDCFAHDGMHQEVKSTATLPGASIFHLESSWKNQNGEDVKISALQGKPRLLVMLYTKCETACPIIVEDLRQIDVGLHSQKILNVEVSIFSIDSAHETPKTLMAFSAKRKLPNTWQLFTSDSKTVVELAASLGFRYKKLSSGEYIHSNVIYFINKNGEVAARKEGLKTSSAEFIKEIIKASAPDGPLTEH